MDLDPDAVLCMIVDSVASRPVVTAASGTSIQEAAALMRARRVGALLIGDPIHPAGILTESDIVRLVAEGTDTAATKVGDVMSKPVITVAAAAQLEDAAERMHKHNVKHLAVVVGDEVRSVVTVRDIAFAMPESGKRFLDAVRARWED